MTLLRRSESTLLRNGSISRRVSGRGLAGEAGDLRRLTLERQRRLVAMRSDVSRCEVTGSTSGACLALAVSNEEEAADECQDDNRRDDDRDDSGNRDGR